MDTTKSLSQVLYGISIAGIGLFAVITLYFLFMAAWASFGILPQYHEISVEVPISLDESSSYFSPKSLDNRFLPKEIEIKKANIEVKSKGLSYVSISGYIHASLYIGFFLGIMIFLARILGHVKKGDPFHPQNSVSIRAIGLLSLGIGVYEFLILLLVSQFFHDRFILSHGHTLSYPSLWELNWVSIFLGLVLLVVSRIFKEGSELQDLENQTV